mgnify:CR=1 FL=1|jgi:hypothetical protein
MLNLVVISETSRTDDDDDDDEKAMVRFIILMLKYWHNMLHFLKLKTLRIMGLPLFIHKEHGNVLLFG